jgi:hypothetical protein
MGVCETMCPYVVKLRREQKVKSKEEQCALMLVNGREDGK